MNKALVTVVNQKGVHARCASLIVEKCKAFVSEINLIKDSTKANAKSIIGIMLLEAVIGTDLTVEADGPDEEEAIQALTELFASGFGEEDS